MLLVDYRKDPALYAKLYCSLNITGTQFLAFRDLPNLIKKHVKGKDALDYGSGAGKSSLYLKSLGLRVDGVDINHEMIKSAKSNDPGGSYKLIRSGEIPSENPVYDLVFSSWVLMEIGTKKELLKVVREIYRVLNEGGIFIAIVCDQKIYNNDWFSLNTEFPENKELKSGSIVKILFKKIGLTIYDYFWSTQDYLDVISAAGLKLIEIYSPLGSQKDNIKWVNEQKVAPFNIYISKK